MGFDADTTAPSAPETAPSAPEAAGEPAKDTKPPLSADQRAKAAERARKHRALKKLKGAKDEAQLKKVAAEVAAEPDGPSWPPKAEILAAAGELEPLVVAIADELKDTAFALDERKAKVLILSCAPAYAQAKNAKEISAVASFVPPWAVALAGLGFVFGPPLVRELRALANGEPPPAAPPKPEATDGKP